jgi:small ligand-binding sensory domain FIST
VFTGWPEEVNRFLLVCDPFTFPADLLLRELDRRQPGVTVIGGMASGGVGTGESRLFLGDRVVSSGGVGAPAPCGGRGPLARVPGVSPGGIQLHGDEG